MTKMKKLLALLLALTMVFALAACSSGSTEDTAEAEDSSGSTEDSSFTTATEGVLTMATNAEFPPYEYYENDAVTGIDAEIAAAIAEKLGLELVIEDMAFDSIVAAVTSGKADMGMAGMTITEERLQSVDFSEPYATGVQVVIVAEDSAITSVDDLFEGGYTIGVQSSTTGDLYATWDLEDTGLCTVERFNRGADAVAALTSGKIDCVIIDNEPAKAFAEANEGLVILDTAYTEEEYAICFSKDNTALSEAVNEALVELMEDGTVQSIIDKYISAD
ncbi:MAG: transporter substrate-binding domain-containing protein [Oscillospiraceae bacterium]|nr:transporter substrate-binding domain-containing protein [Oscillospiraceae bacterium]